MVLKRGPLLAIYLFKNLMMEPKAHHEGRLFQNESMGLAPHGNFETNLKVFKYSKPVGPKGRLALGSP